MTPGHLTTSHRGAKHTLIPDPKPTSPGRDDTSHDGVAGILLHATGVGRTGLREMVLLAALLVLICTGDTPLDGARRKGRRW